MHKRQIQIADPATVTGITRRELLTRSGAGMGVLGLAGLLASDSQANTGSKSALAPKQPHFTPTAKHVIHIFCNGGASQVDTFDPKPKLDEFDGMKLPFDNLRTERKTG